jgi:hypothetical protein
MKKTKNNITNLVRGLCASWIQIKRPDLWELFNEHARKELGIEPKIRSRALARQRLEKAMKIERSS